MDVTAYLPNELHARAKEAGLSWSALLQAAVHKELDRQEAMRGTLAKEGPRTFELYIEDRDGRGYTGRVTGAMIVVCDDLTVYLTDDERVLLYDERKYEYWEIENAEEELRDNLDNAAYSDAMNALGIKPVIDL